MKYFTTIVSEGVKAYEKQMTIVFLVLVFTTASLIFYFYFFKNSKYNRLSSNTSFSDISNTKKENNGTIKFYYFYVDWCPYCTKSLPIYDSLKQKYDNINGKQINYHKKNLTEDTPANQDLIKQYEIDSYPTIFIIDENDKRTDFKSSATLSNLDKFINSV